MKLESKPDDLCGNCGYRYDSHQLEYGKMVDDSCNEFVPPLLSTPDQEIVNALAVLIRRYIDRGSSHPGDIMESKVEDWLPPGQEFDICEEALSLLRAERQEKP